MAKSTIFLIMRKKLVLREETDIRYLRLKAARSAIQKAGGPRKFSATLSDYLRAHVDEKRVAKWAFIGVPVRWGVIVEHLTGVPRAELNPFEYTVDIQLIHRDLCRELLVKSTAYR